MTNVVSQGGAAQAGRRSSTRPTGFSTVYGVAMLAFLACAPAQQGRLESAPGVDALAIEHVTIVDVRDGRLIRDQTVLVAGSKIMAVGASTNLRTPRGARVVDGRDRYLIPGLWDMHDHAAGDGQRSRRVLLPMIVANGVTGTREMIGDRSVLAIRDDIRRGVLLGPRMIVGSPILDGPSPMWEGSIPVTTEADGKRVVDSLVHQGYDFIKIYQFLSRDAYRGIAEEARRQHIPFVGHVPLSMKVSEASDAGQRSIEHGIGISLECSTNETDIRRGLVAAATHVPAGLPAHGALLSLGEDEPLSTVSEAKCDRLFARLAENGTWVVPTLILHRAHALGGDSSTRHDPRLRHLPAQWRATWEGMVAHRPPPAGPAFQRVNKAQLRYASAMSRAHVSLLVGTDAMNPFVFPGFAVHEELALLVEAGLTPLEALRAATIAPAVFLHATDSLGTIDRGKLADLVLLDANPLTDIRNTSRIRAVVLGGRFLDRAALDSTLTAAEKAAGGTKP